MKSTRTQQADYPPVEQALEARPLQLVVVLNATGLLFLRQQLGRDIDTNQRGWNRIGFNGEELTMMLALVTKHPEDCPVESGDNILLTHTQSKLLAIYANRYLQRVAEVEDVIQRGAYGDALYNLMHGATLITQTDQLPLDLSYYGFHTLTRPLLAVWARICALFGLPVDAEHHSFEPFTV